MSSRSTPRPPDRRLFKRGATVYKTRSSSSLPQPQPLPLLPSLGRSPPGTTRASSGTASTPSLRLLARSSRTADTMSAKLFVLLVLVAVAFQLATVAEARNAPPMTRIQEVFRSLMAPEEIRGKKYYQQYIPSADGQYGTEW